MLAWRIKHSELRTVARHPRRKNVVVAGLVGWVGEQLMKTALQALATLLSLMMSCIAS